MLTKILAIMATTVAGLVTVACQSESQPRKPLHVGWRNMGTWSGHGNLQTESFNIESVHWRIKWQTSNETSPGAGVFQAAAHSAVSGRTLAQAVDHKGVGKGTAYIDVDPHLYYLEIVSSGEDWSITVEEAVVGEGVGE